MMPQHVLLVTGGCGFIGANFIRHVLHHKPDWKVLNLDNLTYSANLDNLRDLEDTPQYHLVQGDIRNEGLVSSVLEENSVTGIVHFAAESHVDRSIAKSKVFVQTNVEGTHMLLECAAQYWRKRLSHDRSFRFVHISTDEVYGTLGPTGRFTEQSPMQPNSPYAATKAAADLMARAFFETYGLPVLICRPSNNYGPYQYPEKFIPLLVTNLILDQPLPIYGKGENVRDWIFVTDTCRAIDRVLEQGKPGQAYNIGGESEWRNIDVAGRLLELFGKDESRLQFVTDRPGHDWRYALDNHKIRTELGWRPNMGFETGLEETMRWYRENEWWWTPLKERLSEESKGFWSKP